MHLGLLNQHGAMIMQGCMGCQEPKQVTLQSPLYIKVGKLWLMGKLVICGHGLTMIKQLASEISMSQDVIVCGIVVAIVCGCLYFVCLFSSLLQSFFCTGVFCALFHSNDAISSAKLHLMFSNYWFLKSGFNIQRTAVPPHIGEADSPGIPQWFIDAFCDWAVGVTKNSAFVKWETSLWDIQSH